MEILIRRDFPENKPKKEGYYHTENDFLYWKKGNWYIGHGFSSPRDYTPSYFYEPLTIDGAEEFTFEYFQKDLPFALKCIERAEIHDKMPEKPVYSHEQTLHAIYSYAKVKLNEFSASRVEEKPLSFEEFENICITNLR